MRDRCPKKRTFGEAFRLLFGLGFIVITVHHAQQLVDIYESAFEPWKKKPLLLAAKTKKGEIRARISPQ